MCLGPYCSEAHIEDTCNMQSKMTTNGTVCARHTLQLDPTVNLKKLFSETPQPLHHSSLDPACPARIAGKVAKTMNMNQQQPKNSLPHKTAPGIVGQESRPIVIPDT